MTQTQLELPDNRKMFCISPGGHRYYLSWFNYDMHKLHSGYFDTEIEAINYANIAIESLGKDADVQH